MPIKLNKIIEDQYIQYVDVALAQQWCSKNGGDRSAPYLWIGLDHPRFGMDWGYGSPVGLNPWSGPDISMDVNECKWMRLQMDANDFKLIQIEGLQGKRESFGGRHDFLR